MPATRGNPHCKLNKKDLESRERGCIRKYKAAEAAAKLATYDIAKKDPPATPPIDTKPSPATSQIKTPPVTPVPNTSGRDPAKPITRSDVPTCLDYGRHRRIRYPGSAFCSPCDWYEQEILLNSHRGKSRAKGSRYGCTCYHTSFEEPAGGYNLPLPQIDEKHDDVAATLPSSLSTIASLQKPMPTCYKFYDRRVLLRGSSSSSESSNNNESKSEVYDSSGNSKDPLTSIVMHTCKKSPNKKVLSPLVASCVSLPVAASQHYNWNNKMTGSPRVERHDKTTQTEQSQMETMQDTQALLNPLNPDVATPPTQDLDHQAVDDEFPPTVAETLLFNILASESQPSGRSTLTKTHSQTIREYANTIEKQRFKIV